ncbi:ThuA domain-containing protein [Actinomadura viridis]|uniref:Type 1 glutamine amidotransferase n=1 Tax=Actinomadura viridis TaxID=58110 RepID=A0A931GLX4_9ACTN|nr:ThuA domain-containing protein [Actinomadura viridis]MBG6091490.1 type 1 glutamine amidotransferase [Actinomadura viridis]
MRRPSSHLVTAAVTALGTAAVLVATTLLGGPPAAAGSPQAKPGARGAEQLGDPEYGVCRGLDPRCYHGWGNFDPAEGYKILVYSRTAGPRHANLGPALPAGLNPPLSAANVAQSALVKMGQDNGFGVDWTEDVTQLSSAGRLMAYNAVVFMSTTRDTLDEAAQTALRQYIRGGGGFVGIHNAFGTEYNWPWYEGLLGGANFYDHGPSQPGTVQTLGRKDVSTAGLPARWAFSDEWYNLVPYPSRVRILAQVDEGTLERGVEGSLGHPGHGDSHPIAWCHYYDGGRAWLTTLGHDAKAFTDDGSAFAGAPQFRKLVLGGIESAMGRQPFCR